MTLRDHLMQSFDDNLFYGNVKACEEILTCLRETCGEMEYQAAMARLKASKWWML